MLDYFAQLSRDVRFFANRHQKLAVVSLPILLSAYLGLRASWRWLLLINLGFGCLLVVSKPRLSLFGLVAATMVGRFQIGTGTAVSLNAATVLVPVSFGVWVIDSLRDSNYRWFSSRLDLPLALFLLAGLLSLLIGTSLWDPAVPKPPGFLIVQLSQWGIFLLSAMALWIMANMVRDKNTLHHLVFFYLGIAGSLAIAYVIPGLGVYVSRLTSEALGRTPYWTLLTAVALGQLLFNQNLSARWRRFIICVLIAVLVYTLYWNRESVSTWGSVFVVAAMLVWFRWRRLRWIAVAVVVILVFVGALSSAIYEFAGGEDEWVESGGSRLVLIQRVIKVTMRNPITGLGPAAYRPYARVKPLLYRGAFWIGPDVSSHNNYVDLFSHVGLLGLGLFIWFAVEIMLLGFHLQASSSQGFAAGYVNGMIAAWVGALTLMLFADWILPFVYNIGFPGFQASVLIWLFLGGLVALENISEFQTV